MPRETSWSFYRQELPHTRIALAVLAAALTVAVATVLFAAAFAWPQAGLGDPHATIDAGSVTAFAVGEPVFFREGRFWLLRRADGAFVAYAAADSFRGCTVVWRPGFAYVDPRDGVEKQGWFRDPCHGSVYDRQGTKVFGPSPRNLDRYPVEVIGRRVIVRAAERHLILGDANPELQPFFTPGGG